MADYNGTASGAELDHVNGVTSAIQTQINGKQPLDADLTAIAGLTSAAGKLIEYTGTGTAQVISITTAGKALIDDADADAQRTTLSAMELQTLTDNAIPKANGTAGEVQDSGVIIDDNDNVSGAGILANVQTGTTYTLALSDAGKLVTLSNASAITLTIPANASIAFKIGTVINLLQLGAGQVTVAITSDTLTSSSSKVKITGQYSAASLVKTGTTAWTLFGDIAA